LLYGGTSTSKVAGTGVGVDFSVTESVAVSVLVAGSVEGA
jgi:hypothetical protein